MKQTLSNSVAVWRIPALSSLDNLLWGQRYWDVEVTEVCLWIQAQYTPEVCSQQSLICTLSSLKIQQKVCWTRVSEVSYRWMSVCCTQMVTYKIEIQFVRQSTQWYCNSKYYDLFNWVILSPTSLQVGTVWPGSMLQTAICKSQTVKYLKCNGGPVTFTNSLWSEFKKRRHKQVHVYHNSYLLFKILVDVVTFNTFLVEPCGVLPVLLKRFCKWMSSHVTCTHF